MSGPVSISFGKSLAVDFDAVAESGLPSRTGWHVLQSELWNSGRRSRKLSLLLMALRSQFRSQFRDRVLSAGRGEAGRVICSAVRAKITGVFSHIRKVGVMARLTFAVYAPPSLGLPHLAVVLSAGEVIIAEPVQSPEEGERLMQELSEELARLAVGHSDSPPATSDRQCRPK
jgi:hypothetical protein